MVVYTGISHINTPKTRTYTHHLNPPQSYLVECVPKKNLFKTEEHKDKRERY